MYIVLIGDLGIFSGSVVGIFEDGKQAGPDDSLRPLGKLDLLQDRRNFDWNLHCP